MKELNSDFTYCNELIKEFEKVIKKPITKPSSKYYTGVDLGTAFIVVAVFDSEFRPIAGEYQYASVVKDGMVVDYLGAIRIVKEMKERLEKKLQTELQPHYRRELLNLIPELLSMWLKVLGLK